MSLQSLHALQARGGKVQTCNDATTNCRDPSYRQKATVTAPRRPLATVDTYSNHLLTIF